jgi:hypothetical protein
LEPYFFSVRDYLFSGEVGCKSQQILGLAGSEAVHFARDLPQLRALFKPNAAKSQQISGLAGRP